MNTSYGRRSSIGQPERPITGKLKIQKLVGGAWVTTGFAPDLDAVRRHAGAVGGEVRAIDKTGAVVAVFGAEVA